jgi:hypothetical protein
MDNGNGMPGGPGMGKHEDMGMMDSLDDDRSPSKGDVKAHSKSLNRVSRASNTSALVHPGMLTDSSSIASVIQAHV